MDKKGKMSDVVYPDLMFCVDNFEEVTYQCCVSDGSLWGKLTVCWLLVASHFSKE